MNKYKQYKLRRQIKELKQMKEIERDQILELFLNMHLKRTDDF